MFRFVHLFICSLCSHFTWKPASINYQIWVALNKLFWNENKNNACSQNAKSPWNAVITLFRVLAYHYCYLHFGVQGFDQVSLLWPLSNCHKMQYTKMLRRRKFKKRNIAHCPDTFWSGKFFILHFNRIAFSR